MPHRSPFRFVERAERIDDDTVAVVLASAAGGLTREGGWACSLVAEALAQAVLVTAGRPPGAPRLVAIDRARVAAPVEPGDRLEVSVRDLGGYGTLRRFGCRALRSGALAATAEITVSG